MFGNKGDKKRKLWQDALGGAQQYQREDNPFKRQAMIDEREREISEKILSEKIAEIKNDYRNLKEMTQQFKMDIVEPIDYPLMNIINNDRRIEGAQKAVDEKIKFQVKLAQFCKALRDGHTIPRYQDQLAVGAMEANDHFLNPDKMAQLAAAFEVYGLAGAILTEGLKKAGIVPSSTFDANLQDIITSQNQIIDRVNTASKNVHALISTAKEIDQQYIALSTKVQSTIDENRLQKQDRGKLTYTSIADQLSRFSPPPLRSISHISDAMLPDQIARRILESQTQYNKDKQDHLALFRLYTNEFRGNILCFKSSVKEVFGPFDQN